MRGPHGGDEWGEWPVGGGEGDRGRCLSHSRVFVQEAGAYLARVLPSPPPGPQPSPQAVAVVTSGLARLLGPPPPAPLATGVVGGVGRYLQGGGLSWSLPYEISTMLLAMGALTLRSPSATAAAAAATATEHALVRLHHFFADGRVSEALLVDTVWGLASLQAGSARARRRVFPDPGTDSTAAAPPPLPGAFCWVTAAPWLLTAVVTTGHCEALTPRNIGRLAWALAVTPKVLR